MVLYHQNRLAAGSNKDQLVYVKKPHSLHPITSSLIEERERKENRKNILSCTILIHETLPYYKSAYDIDMRRVIDVMQALLKTH